MGGMVRSAFTGGLGMMKKWRRMRQMGQVRRLGVKDEVRRLRVMKIGMRRGLGLGAGGRLGLDPGEEEV